ncbi:MAG: c-type cytochrome, partial [bacterium]
QGEVRAPPQALVDGEIPYFQFSEGNEGRSLYRTYCAACHSLDGTRLVGPSFAGLAGSRRQVRASSDAPLEEVRVDRAYLRQSIVEPNAQLVEGYPANLMPPVGGLLSDSQLDQLVDYLVRISKAEVAKKEAAIPLRTVRSWKMLDFP